jgi:hypothetical protein
MTTTKVYNVRAVDPVSYTLKELKGFNDLFNIKQLGFTENTRDFIWHTRAVEVG